MKSSRDLHPSPLLIKIDIFIVRTPLSSEIGFQGTPLSSEIGFSSAPLSSEIGKESALTVKSSITVGLTPPTPNLTFNPPLLLQKLGFAPSSSEVGLGLIINNRTSSSKQSPTDVGLGWHDEPWQTKGLAKLL